MKDLVIALILAVIMVFNLVDVIADIGLGVPLWHIFEEGVIVLLSAATCCYLLYEMRARTRELRSVSADLRRNDARLADLTSQMARARRAYGEAIHQQFEAWSLTQSEREVAMLLLKGLSFREIAALRSTQEKTVRQQASSIYAKSSLEGRHAFSAWFLTDVVDAVEPGQ